jgi:hypothetical protein
MSPYFGLCDGAAMPTTKIGLPLRIRLARFGEEIGPGLSDLPVKSAIHRCRTQSDMARCTHDIAFKEPLLQCDLGYMLHLVHSKELPTVRGLFDEDMVRLII